MTLSMVLNHSLKDSDQAINWFYRVWKLDKNVITFKKKRTGLNSLCYFYIDCNVNAWIYDSLSRDLKRKALHKHSYDIRPVPRTLVCNIQSFQIIKQYFCLIINFTYIYNNWCWNGDVFLKIICNWFTRSLLYLVLVKRISFKMLIVPPLWFSAFFFSFRQIKSCLLSLKYITFSLNFRLVVS